MFPQGFYALARDPRGVIGKESEKTYGSLSCNGSIYRIMSLRAWPRGLYGKVWGICKLQASNSCCNLSSPIHSMRRTVCCHKKEGCLRFTVPNLYSCVVVMLRKATYIIVSQ